MTESFLRQRRNLFIVNGILFFCYIAQVDISKLTIAGMNFEGFGKPESVFIFLWIGLAYFFYRYLIYFIEDEWQNFKTYLSRELERSVNERLLQIVSNKHHDLNENCLHSYSLMKENDWKLHYQVYLGEGEDRKLDNIILSINRSDIWKEEITGLIRFALFTPAVTNYLLPVLISAYVLIVCGFTNWNGAIF
ncbi:MAG: hypothetical protein JAY90_20515 [Candidatus Thiodiazotropha lotti]|nr:hypothetical protein [Candidatus Thiodiazotropha lotti]